MVGWSIRMGESVKPMGNPSLVRRLGDGLRRNDHQCAIRLIVHLASVQSIAWAVHMPCCQMLADGSFRCCVTSSRAEAVKATDANRLLAFLYLR